MTLLPVVLQAAPPQWWYEQGVIDPTQTPNDYAAVNQGQVKFMAEQAMQELDAHCPGGAGDAVHTLVASWGTPTATTNDFTAVNLGQLKALAQPFYDRLIYATYAAGYPWNGSLAQANNYAAANIGQVKNLFSFDLTSTDAAHDANGDGLPDWWERYYGLTGVSATSTVPWSGSLTYWQALQLGLNPNDYYRGQLPIITPVSGTPQTGPAGGFAPQSLVVQVTDSNGLPLIDAPITYQADAGQLQISNNTAPANTLLVLTDNNGQARMFFQLPARANTTCMVAAWATSNGQSASTTFTITSDDGTGTFASPFAPTNFVSQGNPDGSLDMSWTNNTDDQTPVEIEFRKADGSWQLVDTLPPGTSSYHYTPVQ